MRVLLIFVIFTYLPKCMALLETVRLFIYFEKKFCLHSYWRKTSKLGQKPVLDQYEICFLFQLFKLRIGKSKDWIP